MTDDGRIAISVQLGQAVQNLQKLRGSLEDVDNQASKTNKRLDTIRTVLGHSNTSIRQTRDGVRELVAAYERQTQAMNALLQQHQRLNNVQRETRAQTNDLSNSIFKLLPAVVSLAGAWQVFQATLGRSVQIDSITKTFYAIQGSMGGAAIEMGYVKGEAQRLGLEFFALAESFKGFSAATKFAHFDLATTKDMFSAVAESASVLGLSGEKTKLVLMALEQMVSKGVVSMEELRRQLGDSLPGAFELGARAMGMGLAEFNKFVASGKLMSEEFLPKFTKTLRETYATAENVGLAMKTPRAEIEKLMNAITFAQDHFARTGFLDTVVEGVRNLRASLESADMQQSIAKLGHMFGVLVNIGFTVVDFGLAYGKQIISLIALIGLLTLAQKGYWVALNLLTMDWTKSGAVAGALARTYGVLKGAIHGATAATRGFSTVAAIATGGITLIVGALASLVIPKVLDFLTGFSSDTKIADNFAQQFGSTVAEAEMQVSRFMVTIGKTDPLAPFNNAILQAEERITKLSEAAVTAMEKASKTTGESFGDMFFRSMALAGYGEAGMFAPDELLQSKKTLTNITGEIKQSMDTLFSNIQKGSYTSSMEVMALTQRIQMAYKAALADPAQAESAKTLEQMWKTLAAYAANYANILDRLSQDKIDKALAENAQKWSETVKQLGIDMQQFQQSFGKRFGMDYAADAKSIDGAIAMYEKLWAASAEGKRESQKAKNAQVKDMEEILNLKEAMLTAEILIQVTQLEAIKTSTKQRTEQYTQEITKLRELGQVSEEIAVSRITDAVMSAEATSKSADAAIAALNAQIEAFRKKKKTLLSHQTAIQTQLNKENNKGMGRGRSGALAGQSVLDSIKHQSQQAADALEKVQSTYAELTQQFAGDTSAAKIERERGKMQAEINKLTTQQLKLLDDIDRMKAGPLRTAALQEYDHLATTNLMIQEQLERNFEINKALIERTQLLEDLNTRAENARNRGDMVGSYDAQIEAINIKLQQQLSTEEKISLEYKKRILEMRKNNDLLGLASNQFDQYIGKMREDYQDTFSNILPSSISSTTDAFADCFSSIISGTMDAGDAWNNFGQTMQNIGKSIISMLIKMIIQMMIVKALSTVFGTAAGASDGAVTSWSSETISGDLLPGDPGYGAGAGLTDTPLFNARGNAFNARGITPFASGGVFPGPTFMAMSGGGLAVAGEAGPEAYVPLGRTREGKLGIETTGGQGLGGGGTIMVVNVFNNAADQVSTRQEQGTDQNGQPRLDLFIEQIDSMLAGRVASGKSALGKSIDKTRGTNPAKALYV